MLELALGGLALRIEAVALVEGAPARIRDEQAGRAGWLHPVRQPGEHPAEQEAHPIAPAGPTPARGLVGLEQRAEHDGLVLSPPGARIAEKEPAVTRRDLGVHGGPFSPRRAGRSVRWGR